MLIPIRRPSTTHLRFASQVAYGFENRENPSSSSSSSSSPSSSSSSSSSPSPSSRVPLKSWQKGVIAFGSAVGAFMDPSRADLIAALGETTGKMAFQHMLERMKSHPEGKRVLADRPRVKMASVGHVWNLPENTFGAAYAKFMGKRDFSPDDRPPVRFMDTEELTYVATRAREIHDFWHVLFELPTSGLGESVLKIVEFQQTYLPMCFISAIGGTIRLNPSKRDVLLRDYMPWALKAGRASSDLMCIYYEEHFHEDLGEVRNKWGILPAPAIGGGTKFK